MLKITSAVRLYKTRTVRFKTLFKNDSPNKKPSQPTPLMRLGLLVWNWQYRLEELRQYHTAMRNLWRQAACCIGLALLRKIGG